MTRLANLVLIACVVSVKTISLEKVSDRKNVTKREMDFFPDWVPFRNKHGNELGEFVSVPKAKPKKRLALPANFILKALVEPEGDDYFEKGQGETDGEDYFEKKEWSDTSRPAEAVDTDKPINHTDISDIDGVVNIITNAKPNIVLSTSQLLNNSNINKHNNEESNESTEDAKEEKREKSINIDNKKLHKSKPKSDANFVKKYEDDIEYEESNTEKRKPEVVDEEQIENDAKKAKILESVDELKERHAEEQRTISEKVKEEENYREEQARNHLGYKQEGGKYDGRVKFKKVPDYEEYDEKEVSVHKKYDMRINQGPTTTRKPKRTSKHNVKKQTEGKLSVFKNPQLYMVYDDDISDEVIPTTTQVVPTRKSTRFSSRYTTTEAPDTEENVRISLVPESSGKEGEPALFFPKTRKSKRKHKSKTTTPEPDSYVAETVTDSAAKGIPTALDYTTAVTRPKTTIKVVTESGTTVTDSAFESDTTKTNPATTAEDTVSTSSDAVTDAVPASTDHKDKEKKHVNFHKEKGGGREHKSAHFEKHEEHGKKAYEGVHEDSKTAKGHHDKEDHLGKYSDHGGHDKNHHHESGHYGDHHHEEHGKKQAKYEESGKHSKGHSTKGSHDIHKKEEYEKKVEFFEEDGDSAEDEKHGGYHNEKEHKAGGHFKKGNLKAEHKEHKQGDTSHFHKGGHSHGIKEHHSSGGHDEHGKHGHAQVKKQGKEAGKKWIYHHGQPAKTANLVVIDRRADQFYHGPQYYG